MEHNCSEKLRNTTQTKRVPKSTPKKGPVTTQEKEVKSKTVDLTSPKTGLRYYNCQLSEHIE